MRNLFRSLLVLAALALASPALASQGSCVLPTVGTVSGLTFVQDINTCFLAEQSMNSGATAPTNIGPNLGMLWADTANAQIKLFDGTSWLVWGHYDASGHIWNPVIGGGTGVVTSATTTDLCSVPQTALTVNGTTTITSFGSTCVAGSLKTLVFAAGLQLTHNGTSLILPNNGANITTVAGDRAIALALGGGNWALQSYTRASGTALSFASTFTNTVNFNSPITISISSSQNDWAPTGIATANVIRLTCSNPSLNVTGLSAAAVDGEIIIIDNIGATNACTFTAQDALSSAANRFAFDRAILVRPGRSLTIKYDITGARWRLIQELPAQSVAGGFKNLRVYNVATRYGDTAPGAPNSQMKISADEVMLEDGNGGTVRATSVACQVDISGSGALGLDTGTVSAPNWYYLFVIYAPATNTTSCLGSLQSAFASVALPSGYTFGARVGANYYLTNNAVTGFQRIVQYGRKAQYVSTTSTPTPAAPLVVTGAAGTFSTSAPVWVTASVTTTVPATASTISIIVSGGGTSNVLVAPDNLYLGTISANPPPFVLPGAALNVGSIGQIVLEASTIAWVSSTADGRINCLGWEDNL